ncbi:substrate-binding domain-containing protein [Novispirillum sp. DQ9]|uniref:substrate-binding domain-containing protein n=1 Tax=Novispirillum sp. DQ9 TaxID=3398612 RepID=UPI003C7A5F76
MPLPLPALAAAAAVIALLVAGAPPAEAQQRETIRVVGSSSMFKMAASAAERFGRGSSFRTPVIESTGTGGGFKLFCGGVGFNTPDVVVASRRLGPVERDQCQAHAVGPVAALPVGTGGVVIVHGGLPAGEAYAFTRRDLWLALAERVPVRGKLVPNPYTRWREIAPHLPDLPILVYGPPPTSGTYDALAGMVMEPGCSEHPDVMRLLPPDQLLTFCRKIREDGLYVEAGEDDDALARRVGANRHAVGVVGFHTLEEVRDLEAAPVDGVLPTFSTITDGSYPLVRRLFVYVKTAHVGLIPGLGEFVRSLVSDAAIGPDGYLADIGLVPLPEDERQAAQDAAAELRP